MGGGKGEWEGRRGKQEEGGRDKGRKRREGTKVEGGREGR